MLEDHRPTNFQLIDSEKRYLPASHFNTEKILGAAQWSMQCQ